MFCVAGENLVDAVQDAGCWVALFCGGGGAGHLMEELICFGEVDVSFVCLSEAACEHPVTEF